MKCTNCRRDTTMVLETRAEDGNRIRRRRKCIACDHRWNTIELNSDALDAIKTERESLRQTIRDAQAVLTEQS